MTQDFSISALEDEFDPAVRQLLVDFADAEQKFYDHPQLTTEEIEADTGGVRRHFVGDNVVYCARAGGELIGLIWCALFDPGTGLEGEVVELVVTPAWRGRGVAKALCARAMSLFAERGVAFACVWTRHDNPAALAVYREAGFRLTDQAVLTWLPIDSVPS